MGKIPKRVLPEYLDDYEIQDESDNPLQNAHIETPGIKSKWELNEEKHEAEILRQLTPEQRERYIKLCS